MKGTLRSGLYSLIAAAALTLFARGASSAESPGQSLKVERGIEKYLALDYGIRRLSVGNPQVLDVSLVDGSTLRIIGVTAGQTTFSVWRDGSSVPTLYTVVVSADLASLRERFSADPDLARASVSDIGGKIVLDGQFDDAPAQSEARNLAKFLAGAEVLDLSEIAPQKVIQVEVEVIAVSRSVLHALGFNLTQLGKDFSIVSTAPNTLQSFTLNPNGNTRLDVSAATPIANAFNILLGSPKYSALSVISALESSDFARTLARPTLVVRSGEKAEFLVGGEIPIPVPQGNNANSITIEYKRFGVSLKVEPTILKDHQIALKIKPSVSELDFTNAVALQGFTIPALKTRETETTVDVKENESLILAGLMFESGSNANEKVPYLGDIPILGKLFQRQRETHEEQELIVTVTPRLVSAGQQDRSRQKRLLNTATPLAPGDAPIAGDRPFSPKGVELPR